MIYVKGHVGINYHSSYDNVMSNTNFILYIPWKGTFQIYVHAIVRFYLYFRNNMGMFPHKNLFSC
jgi:hypothetical protein